MYEMITGPFNGSVWLGSANQMLVYHHDWSRAAFTIANTTADTICFDYASGDTTPGALGALGARRANELDTSLSTRNRVTKNCVLTHLGLTIEMRVRVGPAVANDVALIIENDYRIAQHRLRFQFAWKSKTLIEADGNFEQFPSGRGQDWFSQRANEFQANNGPPTMASIRPFRRPLACDKGLDLIQGNWIADPDGGVTFTTIMSTMADIYGVLTEQAD